MNTIVLDDDSVVVPDGICNLDAFRRWAHSDDFPEAGRIGVLDGQVWVDMSKEQVFTHNQLKQEFNLVIGGLVKKQRLGRFFPDGLVVTNDRAQLACEPDGGFVSRQTLKSGRVRLVEGEKGGYLELAGTPDMVLEIISASTVEKGHGDAPRPLLASGHSRVLARRRSIGPSSIRHLPARGRRLRGRAQGIRLGHVVCLGQVVPFNAQHG
jgi:hypothetical protein